MDGFPTCKILTKLAGQLQTWPKENPDLSRDDVFATRRSARQSRETAGFQIENGGG